MLITYTSLPSYFHQIKPSFRKVNFERTTLNSYKLRKIKIMIHVDITFFFLKKNVIFGVILKSYIIKAMCPFTVNSNLFFCESFSL